MTEGAALDMADAITSPKETTRIAYTVLLLYPDYMADNYGAANYLAHVWAETPEIAIRRAQRDVWVENNPDDDDTEGMPGDFMPMLCIEGHHHDQTNPDLLELAPDLERAP